MQRETAMKRENCIAWRTANKLGGRLWYVSHLPGEGGKDWGYDYTVAKARLLTPYWCRRFRRDCERVGAVAGFLIQSVK